MKVIFDPALDSAVDQVYEFKNSPRGKTRRYVG
jgi:hypothetical protein